MPVEQSPLVATRREMGADPADLGAGGQERVGYIFWGLMAALVAIPEIIAFKWHVPWPTISETVGHLERDHHWVRILVVGGLAVLSVRIVFYPWPSKTPDPPARPLRKGGS
jgi:hypothetical protein